MDIPSSDLVRRAREVVEAEARAVRMLVDQFDDGLVDVVHLLLSCEGHVLVAGVGTSHAVARRFAHLLACSGTPALCVSAADSLHGGAGAITDRDVVYLISKGGQSAEINQFAEIARARGARIVAQTEDPGSPLGQISDAIYVVKALGDVDPYGLIATGSSLVNCAAGDALCVLLLELRGYSRDDFGATHPGGAVGKMLASMEGKDQ